MPCYAVNKRGAKLSSILFRRHDKPCVLHFSINVLSDIAVSLVCNMQSVHKDFFVVAAKYLVHVKCVTVYSAADCQTIASNRATSFRRSLCSTASILVLSLLVHHSRA